MSDTLALSNRLLSGSEVPRYYDLINEQKEPKEKPEEIISRFDSLRRR